VSEARERAIFADRDGTVIEDVGYISDPDLVRLLPGAAAGLAAVRDLGFRLVVVSNQSGVARKLITDEQARAVHVRFVSELERNGVRLDAVRYCPHGPDDDCPCRKPLPGLLVDAAEDLGLDLTRSFMVGDKPSDIEAGRRAGCTTVLLAAENGRESAADHVVRDWAAVVRLVRSARQAA
jgi:D-glycero-D-manno-heptose 1,7-bisphosphate phosphatase